MNCFRIANEKGTDFLKLVHLTNACHTVHWFMYGHNIRTKPKPFSGTLTSLVKEERRVRQRCHTSSLDMHLKHKKGHP